MANSVQIVSERNAPGVLVTFEGGDGAGKSTQIAFLASILEACGMDAVCVREPGGTSIGESLREIVLSNTSEGMSDRAELLIYEAARAQLIDEVIRPALREGAVVLCDRFTDSTVAYQGYGRHLDVSFIEGCNAFAADGIVPDVTIVLGCSDRSEKAHRVHERDDVDRMEEAGEDFHREVDRAFERIARDNPDRAVFIDTDGRHSDTARKILEAVAPMFLELRQHSSFIEERLREFDAEHENAEVI